MQIAYWALLAAGLLPVVTIAAAKVGGGYDNRAPREFLSRLTGVRQRAVAAHKNHFEAFPLFLAGVMVAELCHVPQSRIDGLAVLFVLLRIVYTGLYLANYGMARTVVWTAALACVIGLFSDAAFIG